MEDFIMAYAYRQTRNYEPQNADKLRDELNQCLELQTIMKDVNAYWRKHGTCMGAPGINDIQAAKLDKKIADTTRPWEKQPFSSYALNDNNAKIKRLDKKLAEVSRGFAGWEFEGGRAEANTEMNRLQLFFSERPNAAICAQLKSNGFKWASTQGAWQRQLTDNAIYSANRLDFLKPTDGKSVREHQPKVSVRSEGAR